MCIVHTECMNTGQGAFHLCGKCIHLQIPLTSYIGLILCSAAVANASLNIFEGTAKVLLCSCDRATVHAVTAEYPYSTLNVTKTCSGQSSTMLLEMYVAT